MASGSLSRPHPSLGRQPQPLTLLVFTQSSPPYNVGDQAGFPPNVARGILAAGVADLVTAPTAAPAPATKAKAKAPARKRAPKAKAKAKAATAPRTKVIDTSADEKTK